MPPNRGEIELCSIPCDISPRQKYFKHLTQAGWADLFCYFEPAKMVEKFFG
jgi:hypothetical protein